MVLVFRNPCQFNAVSSGDGDFVVGTATAGHDVPQNLKASNGKSYHYYAESADGTQWEEGDGAWTLGTLTLARTVINNNSLGTTAKIVFSTPPIVSVFSSPPVALEVPGGDAAIPSTSLMLFQQTSAPTGWTKQTTHNDKALRVVNGTASSGGSNSFSSVMAQTATGNHTLSLAESPIHDHNVSDRYPVAGGTFDSNYTTGSSGSLTTGTNTTTSKGSSGAHNHPITMNIQYVDLIIASKDSYAS